MIHNSLIVFLNYFLNNQVFFLDLVTFSKELYDLYSVLF